MAALAMFTACNEDFTDWAQPQSNEEPATVSFGSGSVTEVGTINLADVETETVQVAAITAPTVSDDSYAPEYTINLISDGTTKSCSITADGYMSTSDLSDFVVAQYGKRPTARTIKATVEVWENNGTQAVKTATSSEFNITAIPVAPVIEEAYYLTGTVNGWDNTSTDYELSNGGVDPYENSVFTVTVPATTDGSDIMFKVTPKSGLGGDWSSCLAYTGEEGKFATDNQGDNFVISPMEGASVYVISFNMMDGTYTVTGKAGYETWYLIGGDIADGTWTNSFDAIGKSIIPLGVKSASESNVLVWTGYLAGNGFKLIKTPGSWDDQWGQGASFGSFAKNNGGSGDIKVPSAGYYTVTLNTNTDEFSVEPYTGAPTDYAVGIAGSINGWVFSPMTACNASNNHDWYYTYDFASGDQVKFLVDGWSPNWGSADYPYGVGTNNGDNIAVTEGSNIVVFNDITGAYTFIAK